MTDTIEPVPAPVAAVPDAAAPECAPVLATAGPIAAAAEAVEAVDNINTPVEDIGSPPPGWSAAAKHDWATLPPDVRQAVTVREADASAAFAQFSGLRPYMKRAQQEGTTLEAKVNEWMKIEDLVRLDFESGVMLILRALAKHRGIKPSEFAFWAGGVLLDVANAATANAEVNRGLN